MAEPSSSKQRTFGPSGASDSRPAAGGSSGDGRRSSIEALPDACLCLVFENAGTADEIGCDGSA